MAYSLRYDEADAAFYWAEKKIKELDNYYKSKIPNDELRYVFLLGLAYSYGEEDFAIDEEMKKCEFDKVHYYFLLDKFEKLEKLYCDRYISNTL